MKIHLFQMIRQFLQGVKHVRLNVVAGVLAAIAAVMQAAVAFAQSSADLNNFAIGTLAPSNKDPSLGVINSLTGDVGGFGFIPGGTDGTLAAMFAVFNTATVSIAAVLFMWHVLASTVNGAHDGEFLGKRYHTYWMPIRMTFGVFFIMPFAAGWSPAQVAMAWAAWGGTGIAAAISTTTGMATSISNAFANVPIPQIPNGTPIADKVYQGWSCLIDHRFLQRTALRDYPDDPVATVSDWGATATIDATRIVIYFGDKTGKTASNSICGSVDYTFDPVSTTADPAVLAMSTAFKVGVTNALLDMNANAKNVATAFDTFYAEDDWTNAGNAWDIYRRNAARVFENSVDQTLTAAVSGATGLAANSAAQQITTHGWIGVGLAGVPSAITSFSAGSIGGDSGGAKATSTASGDAGAVVQNGLKPSTESQQKSYTQIQNEMTLTKTNLDAARSQKNDVRAAELAREYDRLVDQAKQTELSLVETGERLLSSDKLEYSNGQSAGEVGGRDIISAKFNAFMQKQARSFASVVAGITKSHSNPLAGMQEIGVQIFGWAAALFLGLIPLLALASLLSLGFLGGLAGGLAVTGAMILIPVLFFGLKLAGILPFTPIIMWIGAVTAYLVIFIESLFGAQLWAMAHLEGEGEGMGQKTMHGYLFLLNLLFRPAIMVISFYLATKLLGIMGGMGSSAIGNFAVAVSNNSSSGWVASFCISLGALWVWIALMESLIHTCYGLVTTVPNQVFAWIGGHFGSNVGEGLQRDVSGAANGMAGSVGGVSNNVGQQGASAAVGAAGKAKFRRVAGAEGSFSNDQVRQAKQDVRMHNLREAMANGNHVPPTGKDGGVDLTQSGGRGGSISRPKE